VPKPIWWEGGSALEILRFDKLPSTQNYLVEMVREGSVRLPVAVIADRQSDGIGSRGNGWIGEEGDLFVSIAISQGDLPTDLPLPSASIYFGWIFMESLRNLGADVWLKWPNDIYTADGKVGGVITHRVAGAVVTGVGIDLVEKREDFTFLDIGAGPYEILHEALEMIVSGPSWKDIFRKYRLEFGKNEGYSFHTEDGKADMKDACLQDDGSLLINGKRIYSLR